MLITILLFSVFVAPLTRAADDTYSVSGDKITIKSDIFKDGTYTDGDNDPEIKCQSGDTRASVAINQEDKDKIKNGEKLDSVAFSIEATDGDATGCPSGVRTAQVSGTTDSSQDEGSDEDDDESCKIEGFGWAICGPSMWIAKGMDTFYKSILEDFLVVKPLDSEGVSSILYKAWDIVRGFANAVFIIIFIIIIYSQLTSIGVSNYGVKKIAPRLVVVAVLVNLSYYICVIGVDLSNILGVAVKDIFNDILSTLMSDRGSFDIDTIEIVAKTLSGGALAVAGITLAKGALLAAAPLILPTLLSLFLAVLVAVLIMSARQALIIILVIISPLAFVAYLLPGTDKLFGKWKDTFITMLVFFPAFSFVFGGANMAGAIISQSADGSVIRYLLGWIVQLAPLAITPLILKFSGGVLGKIAGMVNNPNKGIVDRSRKWAENKSKDIANKRTYANPNLKKGNFLRRRAQKSSWNNRLTEDKMAESEKRAENLYRGWSDARSQNIQTRETERQSQQLDQEYDKAWNSHNLTNTKAMERDIKLRVTTDEAENLKQRLDNRYLEIKGGQPPVYGPQTQTMTDLINRAQDATTSLATEGLRKANNDRALNVKFAEDMVANKDLQIRASGLYEFGADSAVASAITTMRNDYGKSVEEGRQIVKHFELSSEERQEHAMGESVTKTITKNGKTITRTFDEKNLFTREASIEDQIAVGTVDQVTQIVSQSSGKLSGFQSTISEALAKSGVKNKAPFLGGKLINDIAKGDITSEHDLLGYVQEWVANGKFQAEAVATTDPQGLSLIIKSLSQGPIVKQKSGENIADYNLRKQEFNAKLQNGISGIEEKAGRALDESRLSAHVTEGSEPLLKKIRNGDFKQ